MRFQVGLHLNFELRLPVATTERVVARKLSRLRRCAAAQPFEEVSPFLSLSRPTPASSAWLDMLRMWAEIAAEPYDDDEPLLTGDVETACGFIVQPGEGCETAWFGLLRRSDERGDPRDWFWLCCCKTQYASLVSDRHLVTCHASLVRVLDHAVAMGFDVVVHDETHYWETRDEARLIAEVHAMNQLVARVAGAFGDAIGTERVEAPIFEHPRFERLEVGDS
jgi:hypothetical protein